MQRRSPIWGLMAVHGCATCAVVAGVLLGSDFPTLDYTTFVLTSSQLSLLEIWVAFGLGNPRHRFWLALLAAMFLVLVRTLGYFAVATSGASWWASSDFIFLLEQNAFNRLGRFLLVCLILSTVRSRRAIDVVACDRPAPAGPSMQFGLRHLMVATVVAAVLIVLGQQVRSIFGQAPQAIYANRVGQIHHNLIFLVVGLVYSLAIAWLSLWAALGNHRPYLPVAGVLLFALLLSPLWPLLSQQPLDGYAAQTTVTVYQMLVVTSSLMVVRFCGYRLVPRTGSVVG